MQSHFRRITLSSLLALVTVAAVVCGMFAHQVRKRSVAVNRVQELGGSVAFASEFDVLPNQKAVDAFLSGTLIPRTLQQLQSRQKNSSVCLLRPNRRPESHTAPVPVPQPRSLDRVKAICVLQIRHGDTPELIARVNELPTLEVLVLQRLGIDDEELRSLKPTSSLEKAMLSNNEITDTGVKHLARFPNLKSVGLLGNPITAAGLRSLENMKRLEAVSFLADDIPEEAVARLKRSLPNCRVSAIRVIPPGAKRNWWKADPELSGVLSRWNNVP